MRIIKFRAWDKQDKRMTYDVQGFYDGIIDIDHKRVESSAWFGQARSFGEILSEQITNPDEDSPDFYLDELRFEVMQFTGLQDKVGVDIYEGDIVEYHDVCSDAYALDGENAEKTSGIIVWYKGRGGFLPQEIEKNHKGGHYITYWDQILDLKIIGNIHENPERKEAT